MLALGMAGIGVGVLGISVSNFVWLTFFVSIGVFSPNAGLLSLVVLFPVMAGTMEEGMGTLQTLTGLSIVTFYVIRESWRLGRQRFRVSKVTSAIVLAVSTLTVIGWVGATVAGNSEAGRFLVLTITMILMAVVLGHYGGGPGRLAKILFAIVVAGCVGSLIALLGAETYELSRLTLGEHVRTLANFAALAAVALLTLVIFPDQVWTSGLARKTRVLCSLGALLFTSVLLLAASRGALLGVFSATVVGVLWRLQRSGASVPALGAGSLVLALIGVGLLVVDVGAAFRVLFPVMAGRVDVGLLHDTRMEIWSTALSNIDWVTIVLGGGPRAFLELGQVASRTGGFRYAHSFYVDWGFSFGLVGFFSAIVFFSAVVRASLRYGQDWVVLWGAFVLTSFATHGHAHSFTVWLTIGVLLAGLYRIDTLKKKPVRYGGGSGLSNEGAPSGGAERLRGGK